MAFRETDSSGGTVTITPKKATYTAPTGKTTTYKSSSKKTSPTKTTNIINPFRTPALYLESQGITPEVIEEAKKAPSPVKSPITYAKDKLSTPKTSISSIVTPKPTETKIPFQTGLSSNLQRITETVPIPKKSIPEPPVETAPIAPVQKSRVWTPVDSYRKVQSLNRLINTINSPVIKEKIKSVKNIVESREPKVFNKTEGIKEQYFSSAETIRETASEIEEIAEKLRNMKFAPNALYTIVDKDGVEKVVNGFTANIWAKSTAKQLDKNVIDLQFAANKLVSEGGDAARNWDPDTKVIRYNPQTHHIDQAGNLRTGASKDAEGTEAYYVKFPYAGAEDYGFYSKKLKEAGVLGLIATSLTPEDFLGINSAINILTGKKHQAEVAKIKAMHRVKEISKAGPTSLEFYNPLGERSFTRWYMESVPGVVGVGYAAGTGIAGGLRRLSGLFPKLGAVARVGLTGYGLHTGRAEIEEGLKLYGKGDYGQLGGRAGAFGVGMLSASMGFKKTHDFQKLMGERQRMLGRAKTPADKAKLKLFFDLQDEARLLPKSSLTFSPKSVENLTTKDIFNLQRSMSYIRGKKTFRFGGKKYGVLEGTFEGKKYFTPKGTPKISEPVLSGGSINKPVTHDVDLLVRQRLAKPGVIVEKGVSIEKGIPKFKLTRTSPIKETKSFLKAFGLDTKKFDVHDLPLRGSPLSTTGMALTDKPIKVRGEMFKYKSTFREQISRKIASAFAPEHEGRGKDVADIFSAFEKHPTKKSPGLITELKKYTPEIRDNSYISSKSYYTTHPAEAPKIGFTWFERNVIKRFGTSPQFSVRGARNLSLIESIQPQLMKTPKKLTIPEKIFGQSRVSAFKRFVEIPKGGKTFFSTVSIPVVTESVYPSAISAGLISTRFSIPKTTYGENYQKTSGTTYPIKITKISTREKEYPAIKEIDVKPVGKTYPSTKPIDTSYPIITKKKTYPPIKPTKRTTIYPPTDTDYPPPYPPYGGTKYPTTKITLVPPSFIYKPKTTSGYTITKKKKETKKPQLRIPESMRKTKHYRGYKERFYDVPEIKFYQKFEMKKVV